MVKSVDQGRKMDKLQIADKDENSSPYKILKMIDGSDILCKIIQEYSDALVVECPMAVTKQQVFDKPDHMVEHTGLQRWVNFTNDIKFVINKGQILGWGNLAPEVIIYYKMISTKAKEEAGLEATKDENEDELLEKIRNNIERLSEIMEPEDDIKEVTHLQPKKILH